MRLFSRRAPEPEDVFECVTPVVGLVEQYPIVPYRKAMPTWFKNAPVKGDYHGNQNPTIRGCPGIIDMLRLGYLMPLWSDLKVHTPTGPDDPNASWSFKSGTPEARVGGFSKQLTATLPRWTGEYEFTLKFESPWWIKTPPGWSTLMLPIPYLEERPWRVVPGVIDTDRYHSTNVIVRYSKQGEYLLEAGEPLCQLIPFRRDAVELPVVTTWDRDRAHLLSVLGKGGVGQGERLSHGQYVKQREKMRRQGWPK